MEEARKKSQGSRNQEKEASSHTILQVLKDGALCIQVLSLAQRQ
jgi:hypothetical protein